jgi:hypothetical protein
MALLSVGLAVPGLLAAQSPPGSGEETSAKENEVPGLHDFDFLVGHWQVHHRKLKQRLANNHEWIEFEGTLVSQPLMGGYANVDDDVFEGSGRHLSRRSSAFVRRQVAAMVDLVDRQSHAPGAPGPARERQFPQWRRNVLR